MSWLTIGVFIVVGFVVFKFVVKPLFKVAALAALVFIAWWVYYGF